MSDEQNQYEQERRVKRDKLREIGVDPYGQRTEGLTSLAEIRAMFKPEMGHEGGPVVKAAGRIILKRDMGKLSFITLRDASGDLQVGLNKQKLSELGWQVRDLLDLGDQIVVEGPLGQTNKGEISIWATSVSMASKALLSPPAKWEGLSDVELRYRQRYVDLWANPEVMTMAKQRIAIVQEIRDFLRGRGFVEVETPMMQTLHGGANARPFTTKMNALDLNLFMRIAPELYLKRLLVGGMPKIFELNRNFRNEGMSPKHNPEFTMLEAYEAYGSWETMAELVESMICTVAMKVLGTLLIEHKLSDGSTKTIDLRGDESRPPGQRWPRRTMAELVELETGWRFDKRSISESAPDLMGPLSLKRAEGRLFTWLGELITALKADVEHLRDDPEYAHKVIRELLNQPHVATKLSDEAATTLIRELSNAQQQVDAFAFQEFLRKRPSMLMPLVELMFERAGLLRESPAEQLVAVFEKFVEPKLRNPCFVTRVPSVIIPLARPCKDDPFFADVYELAINGQEISPGYTELNDPDVQAAQFKTQVGDREEQQKVDEDFLNALKFGMPPAGGMGLGIDRLIMMLTGAESIRDVILFPLMRPVENG